MSDSMWDFWKIFTNIGGANDQMIYIIIYLILMIDSAEIMVLIT